jgi:hypothetical protein
MRCLGAASVASIVMVTVPQAGGWSVASAVTAAPAPVTATSAVSPFGSENAVIDRAMAELPSEATETSTLTKAGVRVSVDGKTLAIGTIASIVRAAEQSEVTVDVLHRHGRGMVAAQSSTTPTQLAKAIDRFVVGHAPLTAVPYGVAMSVLRVLVWQTAQRNGSVAPMATVKADAEKQMQQYEAAAAAGNAPPLPNGQTAEETYESADAYRASQRLLTISDEENAIVEAAGPTSGPVSRRTQVLIAWMGKALATAKVTVSHVDRVTSANQLPKYLSEPS